MAILQPEVGQETLEATPERLLKFLLAVSRYQNIRARLMRRGYQKSLHDRAYGLLAKLGSFDGAPTLSKHSDPEVKTALGEINRADEDVLRLIGSALRYKYPEQHEYMLSGLQPSTEDAQATHNIVTVIGRMQHLQTGQSPQPTRAKAQEALGAMADKGLDKLWRDKFTALCETVRAVPDDSETREAIVAREQERQRVLLEVRAFFEEWADTARVEFKGRRELIRLGLAQARRTGAPEDTDTDLPDESEGGGSPTGGSTP